MLFTFLKKFASIKGVFVLFILAHSVLLVMMTYTFPRINAVLKTSAFDLKTFGYNLIEASTMVANLDQETVDFYIFPQLFLLDVLYPVLLALFLGALIIRLANLVYKKDSHFLGKLYFLPFIAMFIDYCENISIWKMITSKNELSPDLVQTASIFTQLKGAITTLSWLVILVLFVIWLKQKYAARG